MCLLGLIVELVYVSCVIQSFLLNLKSFLALYFINCQIVHLLRVFLKLDDVRVIIRVNGLFLYLLYSFIILLIDHGTF